jgi:diguanylate cyclase (GGDEF)-like protein
MDGVGTSVSGRDEMADAGSTLEPRSWPAFLRTPRACQVWVTTACLAAGTLPLALDHHVGQGHTLHEPLTALALICGSVLNVEIGRVLEGGAADSQRPHKALSTWSFACAIVLSVGWLLPVVAACYAHARWRGLRVPLWKWVGSAAYVVLAGITAAAVVHMVLGEDVSLTRGDGLRGMVAVLAGTAVFLAVEAVMFHGSAYLNAASDETWLRQTLRQPSFYLTEAGVLLVGGLTAAIWIAAPWFLALLLPVFVLAQRAALHEPLRHRADHDDKTGLLRFERWDRLARVAAARCDRQGRPWSVLFADLDHFKVFNDTWGHLAGDLALETAATALRGELRSDDLVARFGGEEFCVFLPGTGLEDGQALAERIRVAIEAAELTDGQRLTVSVGVATVDPRRHAVECPEPFGIEAVVRSADRALYEAKHSGRNTTRARFVDDDRLSAQQGDGESPATGRGSRDQPKDPDASPSAHSAVSVTKRR